MKIAGGPMQRTGIPDLLAVIDGRAVFLEVKRPGNKATKLQLHRIAELRGAGATAEVVTNWNEALEALNL